MSVSSWGECLSLAGGWKCLSLAGGGKCLSLAGGEVFVFVLQHGWSLLQVT